MKFLIDVNLDGYDTEEEHAQACREFLEDIGSSGICVSVEEVSGNLCELMDDNHRCGLWEEFLADVSPKAGSEKPACRVCGVCGNTGYFSTLDGTLRTPSNDYVEILHQPCICPNGRAIKSQNESDD